MTAPPQKPPIRISNQEVGELIGLSHSSVSRLRAGERGTSIDVMLKIEAELGWELHDQLKKRRSGEYASHLEGLLSDWKRNRTTGPAEQEK